MSVQVSSDNQEHIIIWHLSCPVGARLKKCYCNHYTGEERIINYNISLFMRLLKNQEIGE